MCIFGVTFGAKRLLQRTQSVFLLQYTAQQHSCAQAVLLCCAAVSRQQSLCEPTCGVNRAAAYVALLVEPVVRVVVLTG
eukprot:SAG25_NODE_325_length_9774_cov_10.836899_6_plen_79_part_00